MNDDNIIWGPFTKQLDDKGEPPMPPSIEQRVANLERGVDVINVKLDSINQHHATKSDLSQLETSITRWFMATTLVVITVVVAVAAF